MSGPPSRAGVVRFVARHPNYSHRGRPLCVQRRNRLNLAFGKVSSLCRGGNHRSSTTSLRLAARMEFGDDLPQVIPVEVGINFGGGDAGMAQHFLHRA